MEFQHTSVLYEEVLQQLCIRPDGTYLDGTLGGGGHACGIAARLSGGRLIGLDQDGDAIEAAGERLAPYRDRVQIVRSSYSGAKTVLEQMGIERVDGILLDLGVSSYQLDTGERGFSYHHDAPLDMRMDRRQRLTAAEIVNGYDEARLLRVLREYGEEPFAAKIARRIVQERAKAPIETTGQLADIVRAAVPAKMRASGAHPARRTFQAVRIECNRELEVLEESLDPMIRLLAPGGRFCIITFHSLEDRIVKNGFRRNESPCICPPDFPVCVCGRKPTGRVVTRRPIVPGEKEREENRRAKSAKLRVFERGGDAG